MKLTPSDLEIEVIINRIRRGTLDLQPDFQRGEVWGKEKKQRLIDSILRYWHIPAIHVIEDQAESQLQVLDGQQRLVAIRDFAEGVIRINGEIKPLSSEISELHGLCYEELPSAWKLRFDQFPIRFFRITDYTPEEPGELFFRLNQPSNLTSAEQRNAYYGPAREQTKNLVDYMVNVKKLDKSVIGFSNARMAYDDVIARLCCALENNTLGVKLTSSILAERYRETKPFQASTINVCKDALDKLASAAESAQNPPRYNKATLFSWLWFLAQEDKVFSDNIPSSLRSEFIVGFENIYSVTLAASTSRAKGLSSAVVRSLYDIYIDRSTSRVADISSVFARDLVIAMLYGDFLAKKGFAWGETSPGHRLRKCYLRLADSDSHSELISEFWNVLQDYASEAFA